jgi:hypothetical protein
VLNHLRNQVGEEASWLVTLGCVSPTESRSNTVVGGAELL